MGHPRAPSLGLGLPGSAGQGTGGSKALGVTSRGAGGAEGSGEPPALGPNRVADFSGEPNLGRSCQGAVRISNPPPCVPHIPPCPIQPPYHPPCTPIPFVSSHHPPNPHVIPTPPKPPKPPIPLTPPDLAWSPSPPITPSDNPRPPPILSRVLPCPSQTTAWPYHPHMSPPPKPPGPSSPPAGSGAGWPGGYQCPGPSPVTAPGGTAVADSGAGGSAPVDCLGGDKGEAGCYPASRGTPCPTLGFKHAPRAPLGTQHPSSKQSPPSMPRGAPRVPGPLAPLTQQRGTEQGAAQVGPQRVEGLRGAGGAVRGPALLARGLSSGGEGVSRGRCHRGAGKAGLPARGASWGHPSG